MYQRESKTHAVTSVGHSSLS